MIAQLLDFKNVIKEAGFKYTKTREKVLHELVTNGAPVSIDDLYEKLNQEVNRVTLYRVLDDFVKAGIVYQTNFQTGKAYFEFQKTHHHHVVCTECGYTQHIDVCVPSQLPKVPNFKRITHHALEFFGKCEKCGTT